MHFPIAITLCRLSIGSRKINQNGNGILTQPSGRKQFASRRKRSLEKGCQVIIIYTIDLLYIQFKKKYKIFNDNFS